MGESGRTGFIKGDVTVLADTAKEELDTTKRFYGSFVCIAFSDEVGCVTVEDMHLGGGYIDLRVT